MKVVSALAFSFLMSNSAFAADSVHVYACDHDLTIRLSVKSDQTTIDLRFPGLNGNIINISSNKMIQTDHLQYSILAERETLNFAAFQFPKGGLYIKAEDETNEAGFTFSVDATATTGSDRVSAASVYWGDFQKPESTGYQCVNVAD